MLEYYGIKTIPHPTEPLCIYNYSQLDADKNCPVSRYCRGLVLENNNFNLVAFPFPRFFNSGEMLEYHTSFDWSNFTAQRKLDGSLIILFRRNGVTYCNTRGSWGNGQINGSEFTWRSLVEKILGPLESLPLTEGFTYCWELLSIYNKVVEHHPIPRMVLLSVFDLEDEMDIRWINKLAKHYNWERPEEYNFKSSKEVEDWIKQLEDNEPTQEGLVLRDINGMRLKVKSSKWFALSRLKDNNNVFLPKYMVPLVLSGEMDEVVVYLPELEDEMIKMKERLNTELENLLTVWNNTKHIESQKEFALSIIPQTKFASILFTARKTGQEPKDIWRNSADTIIKVLYK